MQRTSSLLFGAELSSPWWRGHQLPRVALQVLKCQLFHAHVNQKLGQSLLLLLQDGDRDNSRLAEKEGAKWWQVEWFPVVETL